MDLDAFFASVEVIEHPEFKGKPLLIGGSPAGRGVVAAASYEARRYGVHSAMPMALALRRCPEAIVLPTRHQLYRDYSRRVMTLLGEITTTVQQVSIDEAYLELTPLVTSMREAENVMYRFQIHLRDEIGLSCSIGLANNKLVAKIACEMGKPNGFVVVLPGTEASFLSGLPVGSLPGIGPRSAERLNANGFNTLGQIASVPVHFLTAIMGPWGAALQHHAQGRDESSVQDSGETKSVSSERTFEADTNNLEFLKGHIGSMASEIADSLQNQELMARTVTLKLRTPEFKTITRSVSRPNATANRDAIHESAEQLLASNWTAGQLLRLIGIGVSNLRRRQIPGQLPFSAPLEETFP